MRTPDRVERVLRQAECPKCGAAAGRPCGASSGGTLSMSHTARYELAVRAGRVPLPDEPDGDDHR